MIHYASANIYPEALHNRIKRTIAAHIISHMALLKQNCNPGDVKEEVDEIINGDGLAESTYKAIENAIYEEFNKHDVKGR
jgi:hypothetical protein